MPNKTITQVPVSINEIDWLNITVVLGVPKLTVTYHVLDIGSTQIGDQRAVTVTLTGGQITTLTNFITNTVLAAVNTAEGT